MTNLTFFPDLTTPNEQKPNLAGCSICDRNVITNAIQWCVVHFRYWIPTHTRCLPRILYHCRKNMMQNTRAHPNRGNIQHKNIFCVVIFFLFESSCTHTQRKTHMNKKIPVPSKIDWKLKTPKFYNDALIAFNIYEIDAKLGYLYILGGRKLSRKECGGHRLRGIKCCVHLNNG